jgi:hypothetical protein
MLVDRNIGSGGLLLESCLDAVTVVGIKIEDANPLPTILLLPVSGGNNTIVEKTETERHIGFGMMPGRTGQAKNGGIRLPFDCINANQTGPGGEVATL